MKTLHARFAAFALLGSLASACSSDSSSGQTTKDAGPDGPSTSAGGSGSGGKAGAGGSSGGAAGMTTHVDGGKSGASTGGAPADAGPDAAASSGGAHGGQPDASTLDGSSATPDAAGDASLVPTITAVGDPVIGVPPASASIGSAGGTLVSGDGQLTLTIPAGALAATTAIGIQVVANTAPGGTGYAYRFTPDGTTFAQPVTLAFKPTYGQLYGSTLDHVELAFQDAQHRWQLVHVTASTGTGTVTATTTHFTDYAYLLDLALSGNDVLFTKGGTSLHVIELHTADGFAAGVGPATTGNPTWLLDGTVLGNGSDGTLDPIGDAAAYTAPAAIPGTNPVAVSVSFTGAGGAKVTLVQDIHILAHKYRFDVTLTNDPTCTGGSGYSYDYSTTGSIDLTLDAGFAVTSSNPSAAVTPTISAATVCVGVCTATPQPQKTTGLTLTTVTGAWEPAVHRLKLQPRGVASGSPDLQVDCGQAGSHEITSAANPWNTPGYVGYLEGKDGETASQVIDTGAGKAGPSFKLTVVQP